jgi:glycine cleavage system H protein
MNLPQNYKYTKEHEWILVESEEGAISTIKVGITEFAQSELGDLVFVDLPKVGANLEKGKAFCVVESTKAASDVYAPVAGTVSEVNSELSNSPDLVNQSPYEKGWLAIIKDVKAEDLSELMSAEQYQSYLSTGH